MTTTSWYRKSLWYFKGTKEYTRSGFERASYWFNSADLDVDAAEKHIIITGASEGVGLSLSLEIAKRGAFLHLVDAKKDRLNEARRKIISETGNDKIVLHHLNMSKPRDVTTWASKFMTSHSICDVIIHSFDYVNAERLLDEDDLERHFAANTLAAHIITVTLTPLLAKSSDPRVISISNSLMLNVKLDTGDLSFKKMNQFDGTLAYAQTKRQQVSLNLLYATRFNVIKFYCTHPGWTDTPTFQHTMPEVAEGVKDNLRTAEQGADTAVWLALSNAVLKYPSGLFFQDRYPAKTHLPLAWTHSTVKEEISLLDKLDDLLVKFSIHQAHPVSKSRSSSAEDDKQSETSNELQYKNYSAFLEDSEVMWRLETGDTSPIVKETSTEPLDSCDNTNAKIPTISSGSYDSRSELEIYTRNNNIYDGNAVFKEGENFDENCDVSARESEFPLRYKILDFESIVLED